MNKVAKFEKVSFEQFRNDIDKSVVNLGDVCDIEYFYNDIQIPVRATRFSAGHDFKMPYDVVVKPNCKMMIPTGIRCKMADEHVMLIFPRSSLGIKKDMMLANTVPVVDADYYNADNEGHIFICIKNCSDDILRLNKGEAFCQAVFVKFGVADDEEVVSERTGGIGSTNKN